MSDIFPRRLLHRYYPPTFNNPQSHNTRDAQYFKLWGNCAIWNDGWHAVAIHQPGTDFDSDRWEIYHYTVEKPNIRKSSPK